MVLKNTEIAVRCGMMMHHIIMNCVANNIAVPVFTDRGFVEKVLNYIKDPSNLLVTQAKNAFHPSFRPVNETMDGRPWLLGYLARIYRGNIISSTKAKWRAFIKDSVDAYGIVHLYNYRKQERYRIKKEISR